MYPICFRELGAGDEAEKAEQEENDEEGGERTTPQESHESQEVQLQLQRLRGEGGSEGEAIGKAGTHSVGGSSGNSDGVRGKSCGTIIIRGDIESLLGTDLTTRRK